MRSVAAAGERDRGMVRRQGQCSTVILEARAGGFSVDWRLVQPEVARFARVCSYDRAGLGWSALGPHPRTLRPLVWELHTLLKKAEKTPTRPHSVRSA